MYGEKLKRAVEAVDYFLHSLSPQDRFDLILFNDESYPFSPVPLAATPENVEQPSRLSGTRCSAARPICERRWRKESICRRSFRPANTASF
jgi:hypothetical protein